MALRRCQKADLRYKPLRPIDGTQRLAQVEGLDNLQAGRVQRVARRDCRPRSQGSKL